MAKFKTVTVVAKKDIKSSNSPSVLHPPYLQMITKAISMLRERTGSSHPEIAKAIESKHGQNLPPNFKKVLSLQLKKLVKSENLAKVKNSYRVSSSSSPNKSAQKITSSSGRKAVKIKKLSEVKTPEEMKKKVKSPNGILKSKVIGSPRPVKKAEK